MDTVTICQGYVREVLNEAAGGDHDELHNLVKDLIACLQNKPSSLALCAIAQLSCELASQLPVKGGTPPFHILATLQIITLHFWWSAYKNNFPEPDEPLH